MPPLRLLLIACYELGHPPLSLAWPLAFLRQAGFAPRTLDLAVEPFDDELARAADLIAIAVPMHTALRLGAEAAQRARAAGSRAHLCFYGLYAGLNAERLLGAGLADSVIAGEVEAPLVDLARALAAGRDPAGLPGLATAGVPARPTLQRLVFPVPARDSLPALDRYARYQANGHGRQLAGYVEASRGCLHTCRHCPIVPVYGGRFFVVPAEVVLADIDQQVAAGARHITFGDPDFLNGPRHALQITRALHDRWPAVTFDFTTKVEHILEQRTLFPEFAALGATFVVSAIESVSDHVLAQLGKGHTAADIDAALAILDAAGLALQPTLVAFTPWTSLADYLAQLEFIRARGLQRHIPPIQLSIRLLLPPGSPLIQAPDAAEWLGDLDAAHFTYRWTHPDPRLDVLQAEVAALVAAADQAAEPVEATFAAIRTRAYALAEHEPPQWPAAPVRPAPPRLTENWFC